MGALIKKPSRYFAFDTETINRPGGGYACLVLAENSGGGVDYLENPKEFSEIFQFLAERKRLIAYNAAFDVRAILHTKFIPEKTLNDLAEFDCALFGPFRFFHIPGKYLKCWSPGNGGFEIFDIKSFFQGYSLANAAKKYLPVERKINLELGIKNLVGLKARGSRLKEYVYSHNDRWLADARTRAFFIEYAAQDVKVLAELYKVLNESLTACGLENPPLYSPGSVAMSVFGPMINSQKIQLEQNKFFLNAFRAGRIETAGLGHFKGPFNYYDIKSAYPSVIADLPDLASAQYRQGTTGWNYRSDVKAGAYRIKCYIPAEWDFGPFAVWTKENIIFPVGTFETWIMRDGLELAREYNIKFEVLEYAEFYAGVSDKPFNAKINELFNLRSNPKMKLAVKLILNSCYGKMAESDNYAKMLPGYLYDIFKRYFSSTKEYGKYTNFAYAGIITERTRLTLWRAAHAQGAVMLATDGIITRGRIPVGPGLGQWELKGRIKEINILGCGRYELKYLNQPKKEYHFRGFSRPARIFKKMRKCSRGYIVENMLDTKSLKQWNNAIDKSDFNVLKSIKKEIFVEDNKREWLAPLDIPLKDYFKKSIKSRSILL